MNRLKIEIKHVVDLKQIEYASAILLGMCGQSPRRFGKLKIFTYASWTKFLNTPPIQMHHTDRETNFSQFNLDST